MKYSKPKLKIPPRQESLGYGENGPGLYVDETLVQLEDGQLAAVSVERYWQENGSGLAFHAYTRAIGADGSTLETDDGKHIETALSFNAQSTLVEAFGADEIATDLARMTLGLSPELMKSVPMEDGTEEQHPVIGLSEEILANSSISFQLKMVAASKRTKLAL